MKRTVELRPAARRDLDRFDRFRVVRYRVTPDTVVITRIWHGKERRPPR